jgi:hypothetical protein|tara:strand:+ start:1049 stop:1288 length:240 start_codon:yes stop_codon:yes gene_type:complete
MDTEEYEDIPRRDYPHHTTVTMKIDIRKINKDGTLGHEVMGDHLLKKYGISTKAQWCVSGASEAECIKNLKNKMEKLNG